MKRIIYAITVSIVLFACSKKNDKGPLKAVANAHYNGLLEVNFIPIYSTGDIAKWGWQIDPQSSTQDPQFVSPINNTHRLFPNVASVHKPGTYIFGLSVYDKSDNLSYDTIAIDIK